MSYWAQLDSDNLVIQVIVGDNNDPNKDEGYKTITEIFGGTWTKTSYNGTIRKNFAGIGYYYDKDRDAFIPPKPFDSWILDENTCTWNAPVTRINDETHHIWDESQLSWVSI